ncbi:arrestin domain containing 3-like [Silurus meridionalis]|nr:arrestin domain containing 3-like [Silurus meridionalis]
MSTVKQLSLTYDAVNSSNTFTNGDVINGRVVFEVTKEVTIESLYIKCKGDARVKWSERRNDKTYSYSANERYFKIKQYFIKDPKKGNEDPGVILAEGEIYSNVVKPGNHVYPFSFQLPHGNFPASFKGHYGSVKYILEVTLDRSWKMDRTETKEFIFVPRLSGVNLMSPQTGSIEKKMKLFTSGSTSMKATIDKMAFMRGEVMKVSTDIDNSSSRDLKIKYSMEQKQTFHAQGHSKYSSRSIFKVVGDPVPAGSKQTINTNLTLPENLEMTITNCNIIKLEYIFKVYLDVPYASDPEICFSVIILPAGNIFVPVQNQPAFQPNGIPIGPGWNQPLPQPEFGPIPPGATFGPAPGFHPGPYPSPAYSNPVDPPPSYADLYTNPNATAPGFNQALSAPSAPPPYNPQYPLMGYPNPGVPQQPQVPSAPQFCPGPDGPGCVPAEAPPGYWPNPTTQPEPYPTKSPGKHE